MKKALGFMTLLSLLLVCFSSCSGYNKIMRNHLSNPENYQTYQATLVDIFYYDSASNQSLRDFENDRFLNFDVIISVRFDNYDDVSDFLGGRPNTDILLEEYDVRLCIPSSNSKILYENGFYNNVSLGDKIKVTSSAWIYMDGNFFYVSQIEHEGTVYLDSEDGLKNIIDMMNKNKSIF
jgi:hypothetical protein